MGGIVRWVTATPTIDTNIYAAGDLVGTKMSFDMSNFRDTPDLLIQAAQIIDLAKQSADIDVLVFDTDPASTTFTNNAALDIADGDMAYLRACFAVTGYFDFNDNSMGQSAGNLGLPISINPLSATPYLYAALVSRGTPTFAAATDIKLRLGLLAL